MGKLRISGVDLLFLGGLLLLAAGLFAFDWRVAAIVVGGLLIVVSLAATWRKGG